MFTKLEKYGICGKELLWFKSYLYRRSQIVHCNNQYSDKAFLDIGVPQGSILGPILFLLFINDLPQYLLNSKCEIFADDVLIYVHGESIDEINNQLQQVVDSVSKWYKSNRLTLNAKKTQSLLIAKPSFTNSCKDNILNIKIDNAQLNRLMK